MACWLDWSLSTAQSTSSKRRRVRRQPPVVSRKRTHCAPCQREDDRAAVRGRLTPLFPEETIRSDKGAVNGHVEPATSQRYTLGLQQLVVGFVVKGGVVVKEPK